MCCRSVVPCTAWRNRAMMPLASNGVEPAPPRSRTLLRTGAHDTHPPSPPCSPVSSAVEGSLIASVSRVLHPCAPSSSCMLWSSSLPDINLHPLPLSPPPCHPPTHTRPPARPPACLPACLRACLAAVPPGHPGGVPGAGLPRGRGSSGPPGRLRSRRVCAQHRDGEAAAEGGAGSTRRVRERKHVGTHTSASKQGLWLGGE